MAATVAVAMPATTALPQQSAGLRVTDHAARTGALYVAPTGEQARVHEGDCLYRRTIVNSRQGERFVEYRRRRVAEIVQLGERWFIRFADDYDLGRDAQLLDEVLETMAIGAPPASDRLDATYSQTSPDGFDVHDATGTWRTWEPVQEHEREPAIDLTFERIQGAGAQNTVNAFLEGETADVDHALGGVHAWKTGFVARNVDGEIVSALVAYFYNPSQNGSELCVTRLANREDAPDNTSSWMLANARDWAREQDYDSVATYAGVGANAGTCYRAAGFHKEGEPVEREGSAWDRGEGGDQDDETGTWLRQKWVCDL